MSTYTQILYHIIFSTKGRKPVLRKEERKRLFKYIWGVLENKNCHLYRVNGVENHIHIVTHLHPSISLAALVKDIKLASSAFVKKEKLFKHFTGWQTGYSAFTYSFEAKDQLVQYVKDQEEHHKTWSFKEELQALLKENGVEFDERYLE